MTVDVFYQLVSEPNQLDRSAINYEVWYPNQSFFLVLHFPLQTLVILERKRKLGISIINNKKIETYLLFLWGPDGWRSLAILLPSTRGMACWWQAGRGTSIRGDSFDLPSYASSMAQCLNPSSSEFFLGSADRGPLALWSWRARVGFELPFFLISDYPELVPGNQSFSFSCLSQREDLGAALCCSSFFLSSFVTAKILSFTCAY